MSTNNPLVDALISWAAKQPKEVICESCGRPLTDPMSRKLGVGPICHEKLQNGENVDE